MLGKKLLVLILIAIFLLMFFILKSNKSSDMSQNKIPPKPKDLTFSAWLWDAPTIYSEEELQKMLAIARDLRVTNIYLRVDDYVDLYQIDSSSKRQEQIKKFDDSLLKFVTIAKDKGITIEALGGDSNWSEPNEIKSPNLVFDGVINYNRNNISDYQLKGIHFDVEPQNSELYKKNKPEALQNYLNFVEEMAIKKESNASVLSKDFKLGFAVPFWFDNENNNGVEIDWKNLGKKPVVYHQMDILNKIRGGYIAIMDYRNYAEGKDGSIENAKNEIEYANNNASNVKVFIGQETTDVKPAKITFYGLDKDALLTEIEKIVRTYSKYPVFGGISIHHLTSFIDL